MNNIYGHNKYEMNSLLAISRSHGYPTRCNHHVITEYYHLMFDCFFSSPDTSYSS